MAPLRATIPWPRRHQGADPFMKEAVGAGLVWPRPSCSARRPTVPAAAPRRNHDSLARRVAPGGDRSAGPGDHRPRRPGCRTIWNAASLGRVHCHRDRRRCGADPHAGRAPLPGQRCASRHHYAGRSCPDSASRSRPETPTAAGPGLTRSESEFARRRTSATAPSHQRANLIRHTRG